MKTYIYASDIVLKYSEDVIERMRIGVYLNPDNTVFEDWKAIKRALEEEIGEEVQNFTYCYENYL